MPKLKLMLKIRFKEESSLKEEEKTFGTIEDLDKTVYSATEIRIHTPGFFY